MADSEKHSSEAEQAHEQQHGRLPEHHGNLERTRDEADVIHVTTYVPHRNQRIAAQGWL